MRSALVSRTAELQLRGYVDYAWYECSGVCVPGCKGVCVPGCKGVCVPGCKGRGARVCVFRGCEEVCVPGMRGGMCPKKKKFKKKNTVYPGNRSCSRVPRTAKLRRTKSTKFFMVCISVAADHKKLGGF